MSEISTGDTGAIGHDGPILSEVAPREWIGRGPGDGSRAVAVGGGHGLSRCLMALTHVVDHVTAVVTTADDGGSSGRLRREFGVIPPGDLRMALAALSPRRDLVRLFQYRFGAGELDGHSLGNLLIVATAHLNEGDVVAALDYMGNVLDSRGRVLPCTTDDVHLYARVQGDGDGGEATEIAGQSQVMHARRIQEVWLEPSTPAVTPEAVEAIRRADLIVLGPGSLYTSIIPNLLVPGLTEALAKTGAPVVYVANLREQPGETEGLDLEQHLAALLDHAPGVELHAIVAHEGRAPAGPGRRLEADRGVLGRYCREVVFTDLLDDDDGHHPHRLAEALDPLLRPRHRPGERDVPRRG